MDTQVLRRYLAYYVNLYSKQITQKVNNYLKSKKLTLDEWLKSVKDGRRGDILCVYLLSMATGSHTVLHMKHNKVWSTLKDMPASHDELIQQCDKHLVYLGLGIFLQLKEHVPFNILGTITGQDPKHTNIYCPALVNRSNMRYRKTMRNKDLLPNNMRLRQQVVKLN